jgi:hypothetical protein
MIVALVSVGWCLLIDGSPKVPQSHSVQLLMPLSTGDVCYRLVKQESTYRWVAGLVPSLHPVCYLDQKTYLVDVLSCD